MARRHIVMFSGGIGSWAAAKRVRMDRPQEEMVLLFADVKGRSTSPHVGEDEDTYRFLNDAAENLDAPLVVVRDGRDIWQVFKDKQFLGNSRLAPCSHELKQKPSRRWLEDNSDPDADVVYVGIDWAEIHRLPSIERNYLPWKAVAPLTEPPYLSKEGMLSWAAEEGLEPPRLYAMGFSHNNCGGGCVRAGQAQFRHLLSVMPERYDVWEQKEREMADLLGRPVSILRDRRGGKSQPLSLQSLREREQQEPGAVDPFDIGGCGCFVDYQEDAF